MQPNVRLFAEILHDELDQVAWLFIDPEAFEEIAEECPDNIEFTGDVPKCEDSEALAHVFYRALKRYDDVRMNACCETCDNWSC